MTTVLFAAGVIVLIAAAARLHTWLKSRRRP